MAFYWQQASAQSEAAAPSPWDNINLGGSSDNRYQQGYSNWTQQPQQSEPQKQNLWTQQAQQNGVPAQAYGSPATNNTQQYQGYQQAYQQQAQQPPPPQQTGHYVNDGYGYGQPQYDQQQQQQLPQSAAIEHAPILPKKTVAVEPLREFTPIVQADHVHEASQYQQPQANQYYQAPDTHQQPVAEHAYTQNDYQNHANWNQQQNSYETAAVPLEQSPEIEIPKEQNAATENMDTWNQWHAEQTNTAHHQIEQENHESNEQATASIDMGGTWDNWHANDSDYLGPHETTPEANSQHTTQSEPPGSQATSQVTSRNVSEEPQHQHEELKHQTSHSPGFNQEPIHVEPPPPESIPLPIYEKQVEVQIPPSVGPVEASTQKSPIPSAPPVAEEITIPKLDTEEPDPAPIEDQSLIDAIKQEPMSPLSKIEKPLAESTPTANQEEAIAAASLDIAVPSPTDTPVKKDLQTQLSDTQNSDRTSDGFVKIPSFNQELETEYSATNSLFAWNQSGQPITRTLNTTGRFTAEDYREQEANDSGASSILTRAQISNQYLEYKKRIPQIVSRQSMLRGPTPNTGQTGRPNPLFEEGRRSVLSRLNHVSSRPSSTHYEMSLHQNRSVSGQEGNTSLLTNPDVPLDYSFESPQSAYGEGFVENSRRSRLFRQTQNAYRPQQRHPDPSGARYSRQGQHYGYPQPPTGRRSVAGYGDLQGGENQRRRPQSSYDPRALARMERSGVGLDQYDAFNSPGVSSESADGGDSEMDAEMAQYHAHAQTAQQHFTPTEIYLIGTLKVPLSKFVQTIRKFPPPNEFYQLRPIERVAFLFFTALWQRPYMNVVEFHKNFNRDFYTLTAGGVSDDDALYEICAQMQTRFTVKNKERYTNTQKQLFSDERDSHDDEERMYLPERHCYDDDGQSERDYGERVDEASDTGSLELQQRGPLKFSTPQTFTIFGPNGKIVIVDPKQFGPTTVKVMSISTILHDDHSRRLFDSIQMFRGPLTAQTPSHQVTLYIERQIDRMVRSDVAQENPTDNDVVDCLLLWQLLRVVVQQHGKVTGPDIARLLLAATPTSVTKREQLMATHRERSATPTVNRPGTDPKIKDAFNDFLLKGHVEEAIDLALHYEMYADALVLARRVDPTKLAQIEERYINSMLRNNPITTLLTVAAEQRAPILINPPTDDGGTWRAHAAIVLANLNSSWAMSTVYELGKVLAQREYNAAADFCFLAVSLLTGHDVFQQVPTQVKSEKPSRQHISLINASLPDDVFNSTDCKYGFSLTDLHATEIFAYGVSLARGTSPLTTSLEYQISRVKYARLQAEMGFPKNAFKYATDIAQQIWQYYSLLPLQSLLELCDVAEQTLLASEGSAEAGTWIGQLRQMAAQIVPQQIEQVPQPVYQPSPQAPTQELQAQYQQQAATNYAQQPQASPPRQEEVAPPSPQYNSYQQQLQQQQQQQNHDRQGSVEAHSPVRSRMNSMSSQAAEWHNQQDPISIADRRASISSQASVSRSNQYQNHGESPERQTNQWDQQAASQLASVPEVEVPQARPQPPAQKYTPRPEPQQQQQQRPIQQQPQEPVSTPQYTPAPAQQQVYEQQRIEKPASSSNTLKKSPSKSSGGFLDTLVRYVGSKSSSAVKLPDDSKKTIVYDPALGRYVGEGVEEEEAPPPPPAAMMSMMPTPAQPAANPLSNGAPGGPPAAPAAPSGLRAARAGGASRYFNATTGGGQTSPLAAPQAPAMPMPTQFSFMPQMPDSEETVDPFSAAPAEPIDGQQPGQPGQN